MSGVYHWPSPYHPSFMFLLLSCIHPFIFVRVSSSVWKHKGLGRPGLFSWLYAFHCFSAIYEVMLWTHILVFHLSPIWPSLLLHLQLKNRRISQGLCSVRPCYRTMTSPRKNADALSLLLTFKSSWTGSWRRSHWFWAQPRQRRSCLEKKWILLSCISIKSSDWTI